MTAGDLLRAARKAKGLTLREVAAVCACSFVHLSEVEREKKQPSDDLLRKLCEHLGLDPSEMTARSGRLPLEANAYVRRVPAAAQLVAKLAALDTTPDEIAALMMRADELWTVRRLAEDARAGRLDPALRQHLAEALRGPGSEEPPRR